MCRRFVLALAVGVGGCAGWGQAPASPAQPAEAATAVQPGATPSLLSVTVQGQQRLPVRGLRLQDFRLSEGGIPQRLTGIAEHSSQSPATKVPSYPALPPGVFTNYVPMASGETLNVLILDALNTPVTDEAFVRWQLRQYARQADPNTRIAVFGLANRLILLQGFTSDPTTLRDLVERKLIARVPAVRDAAQTTPGAPSEMMLAANLRQFEGTLGEMETELRAQYTLDAFNTLAHYLGAFPGRKNVIWVAGVFPFDLAPDPAAPHPFNVEDIDQEELRETVGLMGKAQVAVYPVDARSLIAQWEAQATAAGAGSPSHAHHASGDLSKTVQAEAAEHAMMEAIAKGTGGRAFYPSQNLAEAVERAVADGSNYYTLRYTAASSPAGGATGGDRSGSYRPIHVEVTGAAAGAELPLSYRRAIYIPAGIDRPRLEAGKDSSENAASQSRAGAYRQAAMSRGGPAPEDLLFRVRVLPASTTTETTLAPDNQLAPVLPPKGPFRRYDLDFLALPGELTFTEQPDGRRLAKVEFLANVFDTQGNLLDEAGRGITLEPLTNDETRIAHSLVRSHLEVSVPEGFETFLRIGVRDVAGNRLGVMEIPVSAVSWLTPATDVPASQTSPAGTVPAPGAAGRPTPPQD